MSVKCLISFHQLSQRDYSGNRHVLSYHISLLWYQFFTDLSLTFLAAPDCLTIPGTSILAFQSLLLPSTCLSRADDFVLGVGPGGDFLWFGLQEPRRYVPSQRPFGLHLRFLAVFFQALVGARPLWPCSLRSSVVAWRTGSFGLVVGTCGTVGGLGQAEGQCFEGSPVDGLLG